MNSFKQLNISLDPKAVSWAKNSSSYCLSLTFPQGPLSDGFIPVDLHSLWPTIPPAPSVFDHDGHSPFFCETELCEDRDPYGERDSVFGGLLAFLSLLSHDAGLFIIAVRGPWDVLSSTKVALGPYLSQYHSGKEYIGGGGNSWFRGRSWIQRFSNGIRSVFFVKLICKALSVTLDSWGSRLTLGGSIYKQFKYSNRDSDEWRAQRSVF